MSNERNLHRATGELRTAFDGAFALPYPLDPPRTADLLEIRVAGQRYALDLTQVAAVHEGRKLVPVPSPRSDLLGLIGVRGVVAPVYDLAQLLGHASVAAPRWVALLRGSAPFGVAFERFERHLRVASSDVTLAATSHATSATTSFGSVRSESGPLPLIDLFVLFRAVMNGVEPSSAPKREDAP